MRYFLTLIKVEGFRGINNESDPLELHFRENSVNSVFAENALGKSSIFDALCYAIRGVVPKLQVLQAQESPDEYIANRFHSKGIATVDLAFQADDGSPPIDIRIERDATGKRAVSSPSGHPDPQALLESLNEDFALLDYRTFQDFIDNTPLKRGRSFAALLGLSRYAAFTRALRSAADTRALNSDLDLTQLRTQLVGAETAAQSAIRRLASAYGNLTGKQLSDVTHLDRYVGEVLAALAGIELVKTEVQRKTLEEIDFGRVNDQIRTEEHGEKRRELENLIWRIETLKALGAASECEIDNDTKHLKTLLTDKAKLLETTRGDRFRALYSAAEAILKAGQWDEKNRCPLCESGLKTPIDALVADRLHQYVKVESQNAAIKDACEGSALITRLRSLESAQQLSVSDSERQSHSFARRLEDEELEPGDVEKAYCALTALEKKLSEALDTAKQKKEELERELPPSLVRLAEQVQAAVQFRDALADHRENTGSKNAIQLKLGIRERWQEFIRKAENLFAEAEADLAQRKIAEIDKDYKEMFARIMGIDDVVPELQRPDNRQDLHVHLKEFHGLSGLSARALLSESFRNALAVSVFLSAALKNAGAPRFVVLDDVTSSFDSGHQWNLMEAIRLKFQQPQNPAGLQFIILSHDGLLAKYFDKLGNTHAWHHQKLHGIPPIGAVMSQAQDTNRVRSTALRLLNAGQTSEAHPLLRQYLEYKLLEVINKVSIPVPLDFAIKDHQKMVSNCLNAIEQAIDLHKRAGDLILDPSQQKDVGTIHVPFLVGNWVSHYETACGTSVSAAVLKGVIRTIDDFAECFRYDDTSSSSAQRRWYKSLSSK